MARSVRAQVHEWLDDRDARPAGTLGVQAVVVAAVTVNVAAVADFRRLLDAHPDLARSIARVAEERLGPGAGRPLGPPATPSS
jgi:hypothetical protein